MQPPCHRLSWLDCQRAGGAPNPGRSVPWPPSARS